MCVIGYAASNCAYACRDTEFDCYGINGEISYCTTMKGRVSNDVTAEPSVPEFVSRARRFQTPLALPVLARKNVSSLLISSACTYHHHANLREDSHQQDYQSRYGVIGHHRQSESKDTRQGIPRLSSASSTRASSWRIIAHSRNTISRRNQLYTWFFFYRVVCRFM